MVSPYNWNFPQRNDTMFMSTIESSSPRQPLLRQSSFQRHDVPGAQVKQQIPEKVTRENFSNSTYIEPIPNSHVMKNKFLGSGNLRTNDIVGAQPQCSNFKTSRVTNPMNPKYKLPYVAPVDADLGRQFLRDTLDISDIKTKNKPFLYQGYHKQSIQGSSPTKLFRTVEAVNRLDVKDINRDGTFISKRIQVPTNPLEPSYSWRDSKDRINYQYGDIGNRSRMPIEPKPNRKLDMSLNAKDIEGTKANSYYDRKLFLSKRRQLKDSLNISDIPKTMASSLKKGISTTRHVNPLMPSYDYPQLV